MNTFYSNGKLLLTAEYFVLNGATALALPTKFGQDLTVKKTNSKQLIWKSYTKNNNCWLKVVFSLPKLQITNATFTSEEDGGKDTIAEDLLKILLEVQQLNPKFLKEETGFEVTTKLTFPRNWGLGTSSTLINNLAQWANVNPYKLLEKTFGGSGYDIACATCNYPILYTKNKNKPKVELADFSPNFKENLYFVYLNKKQNSRFAIKKFKQNKHKITNQIEIITQLTNRTLKTKTLLEFEKILKEHEILTAKLLEEKPVQELLFSDYFGQIKSLGAWGGDFILATGNKETPNYFKKKGFHTVIPYEKIIL